MHPRVESTLGGAQVAFKIRSHADLPVAIRSPYDFAAALGYDIHRIAKTLLLRAVNSQDYSLVVASVPARLDFAKIAAVLGGKRVQLASKEELSQRLDYPPTGVSPLGADLPVLMDAGLVHFSTILIGSGEVGVEIEIAPDDLKELTHARIMPLAV